MEKITLTTLDTIAISGIYYDSGRLGDTPKRAVLCLHMMPATKESWMPLAELVSARGFGVLAVDLRGHGESTGGPEGYKDFSDMQHMASKEDVRVAISYLHDKGFEEVSIVGASIGANLALQALWEHEEIKTAVLLSPGLNYHGLETMPIIDQLAREKTTDKKILFVTSEDDIRKSGAHNAEMTQQLYLAAPDDMQKKIIVYHAAGHGTDMFGKETPDLTQEIIRWLEAM